MSEPTQQVPADAQKKPVPVRVLRIGLYVMLGLSGLLFLDVVLLMIFFRNPPDNMAHSSGSNAVWVEQQWVGEQQDGATYDLFAATLEHNAISDVFFHIGPLAADGTIDPAVYGNAEALLAELEIRLPALRAQAWIGGREKSGDGSIDLADQTVRSRIAGTAATLLALGFDGIHYNIVPIESGNRRLLALIDLTRPLVDAVDGTLSVAAAIIEPLPGTRRPIGRIFPEAVLWSREYYAAVAERVDQVTVRMYDTGIPFSWAYSAIVGWLTPRVWQAMAEGQAELLIGVPTHRDEGGGFSAGAETLESALTGIAYAIPRDGDAPPQLGLAIHAYGTTDDADWATWRRYWLGLPAE